MRSRWPLITRSVELCESRRDASLGRAYVPGRVSPGRGRFMGRISSAAPFFRLTRWAEVAMATLGHHLHMLPMRGHEAPAPRPIHPVGGDIMLLRPLRFPMPGIPDVPMTVPRPK